MTTLSERLQQDDVKELSDWEAADILNKPDPVYGERIHLKSRQFGIGTILEIFGPVAGPVFLETLETLASTDPLIKWSLVLLKAATLDAASPTLRDAVDQMVSTNVMSQAHGTQIKALGEERRNVSWAEANAIEVTPRMVGLARGGA